ncbi:AraC family transcriptional regulator [Catenulispora subtropica]|uniref:helix-turn-helix domain-containing protein n=1 Tax=Catenulispora subtropica TaxID=450798 RepID=UPI0031E0012C
MERVTAWRPPVPGVAEVFHAHFTEHVYPMHAHATWTLLIVDDGAVRYDLDRHEHGAPTGVVTLLPPDVPHNGRSADPGNPDGFRKRVLYLERDSLGLDLIGAAVDHPAFVDPLLRQRIHQLHGALRLPGEELEAESRLTLVRERLRERLAPAVTTPSETPSPTAARLLRDLIDARIVDGVGLEAAAEELHFHPAHLIRSFTREYGMAPHRYLTSRRVDLARGLLLAGMPPAEAATASGFWDQSHLARHFKRVVGVSPGRYAGDGRAPRGSARLAVP